MKALILFALLACSTRAPKAPQPPRCERVCPVGEHLAPIEPQAEHVLDDCCVGPFGITWSACAWNEAGRYMTREQLMDPARLDGACGGAGYPNCETEP